MKLTNLERAYDSEVEKWLEEKLKLTPYQKDVLRREEIVRFSKFDFYKPRKKGKVSFLWRFTFFLLPVYIPIVYLFMPIKFMFTGKWGYGQKFYDNFHAAWMNKLNM